MFLLSKYFLDAERRKKYLATCWTGPRFEACEEGFRSEVVSADVARGRSTSTETSVAFYP